MYGGLCKITLGEALFPNWHNVLCKKNDITIVKIPIVLRQGS